MSKEQKTNAMRILDQHKVSYEAIYYECDDFIDAVHTLELTGTPAECSFKTLVAQGKSEKYSVFVIPVAEELDLKKAAKAVDEKFVELIPVNDINKITGYVRGGCSPLGMKRVCRTVMDRSAEKFDQVYISGGKLGCTIRVNPIDVIRIINGTYEEITLHS
ncbi:MAG: Cys-tRNA(Pro) deacylase [Candidatus Cloacimonetes bacterium]|nr:Cys-tRNA(Pro) deacylase [Candidatus Cloacimonadota bacterium]MCK9332041.1 Cys-tRNA(Pro) deacylase [Candidatus Cloacimonadota bacterium]MDD3379032.1 Cys-tRNA(Pro) deacylase [Candidatus Methanomethylophilaceae archaeon]